MNRALGREQHNVLQAVGTVADRMGREDELRAWAAAGQVAAQTCSKLREVVPMLQQLEELGLVTSKTRNGLRLYQLTPAGQLQGGAK